MIKLVVTNSTTKDRKEYRLGRPTIVIGRAANCDVMLDSDTVSRRHLQIVTQGEKFLVEDLGSGNGTFVNQKKIVPKELIPIVTGDRIRIEAFEIEVQIDTLEVTAANTNPALDVTDPEILEVKMIKKILGAFDQDKRPVLMGVSAPHENLKVFLDDTLEEFIIGRDMKCHLPIDDPTISREHAKIRKKWGGYVITDLGSKNGSFVNGIHIQERMIADGDEITLGTVKIVFKNPQEFNIDMISQSLVDSEKARDKIKTAADHEAAAQKQKPAATAAPGPEATQELDLQNPKTTPVKNLEKMAEPVVKQPTEKTKESEKLQEPEKSNSPEPNKSSEKISKAEENQNNDELAKQLEEMSPEKKSAPKLKVKKSVLPGVFKTFSTAELTLLMVGIIIALVIVAMLAYLLF